MLEDADPEHFLHRIENLYPRLRKYENIGMPLVEPSFNTGIEKYDSTWHKYHLNFLKRLSIDVEDDTFDLDKWNAGVKESNQERVMILFAGKKKTSRRVCLVMYVSSFLWLEPPDTEPTHTCYTIFSEELQAYYLPIRLLDHFLTSVTGELG